MRAICESQACLSSSGVNDRTVFFRRSMLAGLALFALIALTYSAHTQGNQPAFMSFQSAVSTGGQNSCIDISGGNYQPGAPVALSTCTGAPNQTFGTDTGALTAGGLCFDAQGAGAQSSVTMGECSGGASQGWQIRDFQNGRPYQVIVNVESMCITRQGAQLTLEPCQETDAQGWVQGTSNAAPQAAAGQPAPPVVYNKTYPEPTYYWREGRRTAGIRTDGMGPAGTSAVTRSSAAPAGAVRRDGITGGPRANSRSVVAAEAEGCSPTSTTETEAAAEVMGEVTAEVTGEVMAEVTGEVMAEVAVSRVPVQVVVSRAPVRVAGRSRSSRSTRWMLARS